MAIKKSKQIALLTVFAMTLVVIGHSDITDNFKHLWIYKWVYSFHMPLFFFISGFLFYLTNPIEKFQSTPYIFFIKKKSVRLLIPFLFINSVIFLVKALLITDTSMLQHPVTLTLSSFLHSTFISPMGFMWFLPTLFVIFLLAYPLLYIIHHHRLTNIAQERVLICLVIALISALVSVWIINFDFFKIKEALYFFPFFIFGMLYCQFKPIIDKFIRRYWIGIGIVSISISASLVTSGYIAAIWGIMFSVTIALILESKCGEGMIILSGLCYTVFLLSYFPQMFIRGPIASRFPEVNEYWFSILSFGVGLFIPLLIGFIYIKIRQRNISFSKTGILIGL